jgi:hypothetical protein
MKEIMKEIMKETVTELEKKLKILSEQCTNFIKAMDCLALIKFDNTEKKRKMIEDVRQMYHETEEHRQLVMNAIDAFQKICDHKYPDGKTAFKSSGHDSHYSYDKCEICGKEIKC